MPQARRLITTADDFGLSVAVNEAVEQAALRGTLTSASLMVAGPAAEDAVARARRCPQLAVGLHLVVIEGPAVLPPAQIGLLVDAQGQFPSDQWHLGIRYYFSPAVRRQLAAEIRAQFEAFARTGLKLDHANAHKHMHLHPTVGRMMIEIGGEFGLRAIRIPREPARQADSWSAHALRIWCGVLRGQARRAGYAVNDHLFGLQDSGRMNGPRVAALLTGLPPGLSELYFHPATRRDETLARLMPDYEHVAEWDALMHMDLPRGITLTQFGREPCRR